MATLSSTNQVKLMTAGIWEDRQARRAAQQRDSGEDAPRHGEHGCGPSVPPACGRAERVT